jgi:hypothetical protein
MRRDGFMPLKTEALPTEAVQHFHIAEAVQHFITAMDAIKLELHLHYRNGLDVDDIQPLISDLYGSLNKVKGLPPDLEGKAKLENWLKMLNAMRASDTIDEEQARQLLFDLDESYSSFLRFLNGNVEWGEEKIKNYYYYHNRRLLPHADVPAPPLAIRGRLQFKIRGALFGSSWLVA